jgi:hypothetical protein
MNLVNTRSLETAIERIVKSELGSSHMSTIAGDSREREVFQKLLDSELNKIEKFYLAQVMKFLQSFNFLLFNRITFN